MPLSICSRLMINVLESVDSMASAPQKDGEFALKCWAIGQHKDLYRSLSETMRASSSGSCWSLESRGQSWIPGTDPANTLLRF